MERDYLKPFVHYELPEITDDSPDTDLWAYDHQPHYQLLDGSFAYIDDWYTVAKFQQRGILLSVAVDQQLHVGGNVDSLTEHEGDWLEQNEQVVIAILVDERKRNNLS